MSTVAWPTVIGVLLRGMFFENFLRVFFDLLDFGGVENEWRKGGDEEQQRNDEEDDPFGVGLVGLFRPRIFRFLVSAPCLVGVEITRAEVVVVVKFVVIVVVAGVEVVDRVRQRGCRCGSFLTMLLPLLLLLASFAAAAVLRVGVPIDFFLRLFQSFAFFVIDRDSRVGCSERRKGREGKERKEKEEKGREGGKGKEGKEGSRKERTEGNGRKRREGKGRKGKKKGEKGRWG